MAWTQHLYGWGLGLGLVAWGLGGCQGVTSLAPTEEETDRLAVTVTIPPQQYFLEKIGGDRLAVEVLVPGANDPHTYEPKPQQLQALSQAEAYVAIGLGFEGPWLDRIKAANPNMVLIDSAQGITPLAMAAHDHGDHEEHDHGDSEKDHHDHGHDAKGEGEKGQDNVLTQDPHIWLSPRLVKQQAQTIAAQLSELDPDHRAVYEANLAQFLTELDQLDQDIKTTLTPLNPRKFIVYHPSWGYFAQDYDLEQVPIEEGGQEPSPQALAQLIDRAKQAGLRVIFSEPQFSAKAPQAIAAELQGTVVMIDPLAADWSNNLRQVAQALRNAQSSPAP